MLYFFPFALLAITTAFLGFVSFKRRGKPSFLDIGTIFAIIVTIYGFFPGVAIILASRDIGYIEDGRMIGYPDIFSIEQVQVIFLFFLTSFCASYFLFRKFGNETHDYQEEAGKYIWLIFSIALLLAAVTPVMKILLGVEFSTDYIGTYTELRNFPLIIQQIFGVIDQLSFSFMIASIVFAIAYKPHWYIYIMAIVLLNIGYASVSGGSRTAAFIGFFAYLVAVSIFVRTVNFRQLAPFGAAALVLFMLAGYWRSEQADLSVLSIIQGGEFMALFVNSVDLQARIADGTAAAFRYSFTAIDFLKMIPAQLLAIEKVDPGTWYVQTFYPEYYAAGGGFAFGAIAESVMGLGPTDAAIRGALLGFVFAFAGNRLIERRSSILGIFIYVWLTVVCYQSFRDTTFSFMTRSLYQILPIFVLLRFVGFRPRESAK